MIGTPQCGPLIEIGEWLVPITAIDGGKALGIEQRHYEHYAEHGFAIVDNFLTPEELHGAREEIKEILPGWIEFCDDPTETVPEWPSPRVRNSYRFPYRGKWLNHITLHPQLRALAQHFAGGSELYCEQGNLHAKRKGDRSDVDQGMHCDYGNHTLAYPPDLPEYWQTAYLLYYTDVTINHAPTAVCSWKHYPEKLRVPAHYTREQRPEIFENEVKVVVPAGGLLVYSMRTFHRGTPFLAEGGRIGEFITYSPATWRWLGIDSWSVEAIRPEFRKWIEKATPQERELFGFPNAMHTYWTEETIEGVSARYPGMDMSPYLRAVESRMKQVVSS